MLHKFLARNPKLMLAGNGDRTHHRAKLTPETDPAPSKTPKYIPILQNRGQSQGRGQPRPPRSKPRSDSDSATSKTPRLTPQMSKSDNFD